MGNISGGPEACLSVSVSGQISLIGDGGADISLTVSIVGFKHAYSEWILSVSVASLMINTDFIGVGYRFTHIFPQSESVIAKFSRLASLGIITTEGCLC